MKGFPKSWGMGVEPISVGDVSPKNPSFLRVKGLSIK
jgi:hypothetical protein